MNSNKVKPFLRWAGGKKWLVSLLAELVDIDTYESYYEPFLGGGSVFFELHPKGKVFLSDTNEDLISTYKTVKTSPNEVWTILSSYKNSESEYYAIREYEPIDPVERAARFIYLNQTSYNGLYRVNRDGKYNVPYGRRKNVPYNEAGILACSQRLQNAVLTVDDFATVLQSVKKGDFIYLDPPYVVAKDVNGFIQYNKNLFSFDDQKRLSESIDSIRNVGAYYVLSNAMHDTIKEIFQRESDSTFVLSRTSIIGGKKAYRGKTEEYLFTNIPGADKVFNR